MRARWRGRTKNRRRGSHPCLENEGIGAQAATAIFACTGSNGGCSASQRSSLQCYATAQQLRVDVCASGIVGISGSEGRSLGSGGAVTIVIIVLFAVVFLHAACRTVVIKELVVERIQFIVLDGATAQAARRRCVRLSAL